MSGLNKKEMQHAMVDGKTLINRSRRSLYRAKIKGNTFYLSSGDSSESVVMEDAFYWDGWEICKTKRIAKKASEIFKILEDEGYTFEKDRAWTSNGRLDSFYYEMLRECEKDIAKSEWTWRDQWVREE